MLNHKEDWQVTATRERPGINRKNMEKNLVK